MKKLAILLTLAGVLSANDSFNSEMSHFVGGAALAGVITAGVDQFAPEYKDHRADIGFVASSVAIILEQTVEYSQRGNARGQLMDATSHIIGSALGAYVTDKYMLTPVVGKTTGLFVGWKF